MWSKINYETGLKILSGEYDDIDLAISLIPSTAKNKTKEFRKNLLLDTNLNKANLENFKVPKYFMFKKVPKDLLDIDFKKVIELKEFLKDKENVNIFNICGRIVSIVLGINEKKTNERNFIQVVGLGVFFLSLLRVF